MLSIVEKRYTLEGLILLILLNICDALYDLVPFVQFKKREKHPWSSVTFSKVTGFSV